jgi:spermidine synthase
MIPWKEIDRAKVPGNEGEVILLARGEEFSIRTAGTELMNSRIHGSEESLAELTLSRLDPQKKWQILIGGLGMGYTLAATLEQSSPQTQILVSELIPAVVKWNQKYLGHLAGIPLEDPRVRVTQEDVVKTIKKKTSAWDAILLDVDNGPAGLTRKANDRLYGNSGLKASFDALRPGGILAVWSSSVDEAFTLRMKRTGFKTEIVSVRARKSGKGSKHTIWLGKKP